MKYAAAIVVPIVLICSCGTVSQVQSPEQRAKEFLSNIYTGKQMRSEEWLNQEARSASLFNAFGGLERMIQQSTARAERYGGLKSVDIREVKSGDRYTLVKAEVKFARDHKSPNNAVADNEDIIWDLRFAREESVWKIAP